MVHRAIREQISDWGNLMAKLSWNKFTSAHPKSYSFTCSVASALPKTKRFDNKGMKLPSPYTLFCEWLNANLVGDWTSVKITGGFMVKVSDFNDLNNVLKHYPGNKTRTLPRSSCLIIVISISSSGSNCAPSSRCKVKSQGVEAAIKSYPGRPRSDVRQTTCLGSGLIN